MKKLHLDPKDIVILEDIQRFLPNLSMEAKMTLMKLLLDSICHEYSSQSPTCENCPLTNYVCRHLYERLRMYIDYNVLYDEDKENK